MQAVGGEIGGVGSQNADRNFDRTIVDAAFDAIDDPSGDEADGKASEVRYIRRMAASENVGVW